MENNPLNPSVGWVCKTKANFTNKWLNSNFIQIILTSTLERKKRNLGISYSFLSIQNNSTKFTAFDKSIRRVWSSNNFFWRKVHRKFKL